MPKRVPQYDVVVIGASDSFCNTFNLDPATIAEARAMLSGQEPSKHVTGLVVAEAAPYNAPWSVSPSAPSPSTLPVGPAAARIASV